MSVNTWTVLLAILGLSAELFGLGLVAFDIAQDRRRARELLEGDAGRFPVGRSITMPYRIEGHEAAVEGRLNRVEEQIADLQAVEGELRSAYQDELAKRVGALVRFLNEQLSGGIGRRAIGAVLFAGGALLGAAANVVGALA